MSDSYLKFANTRFGAKLTSMLGLPQPLELERFAKGSEFVVDSVLLGAAANGEMLSCLTEQLAVISGRTVAHPSISQACSIAEWQAGDKVKALVFDATQLRTTADAQSLYEFFSSSVRSIIGNGRVVILGRPPQRCDDAEQAVVQRALEGFSRSLAKEVRKAINVQLVYVEPGAEQLIESSLRFFLSARSAYVSGQVVTIVNTIEPKAELNWQQPLAGKTALVTGASQGIGLAIAQVLARDGATVVGLDIPAAEAALSECMQQINGQALVLDLTDAAAPQKVTETAVQLGGFDVVVHNAGITKDKTIAKMSPQWWSQVVTINLEVQQQINSALLAADALKRGGRIVGVSSISGIAGNRGQTNYAFSKAGVIGMVDANMEPLADRGITINAVAPGFIETKMTAAMPFAVREAGRRLNSLSQGGLPVDVAEAVAWFASPASAGVTGNVVRVCGQSLLGA